MLCRYPVHLSQTTDANGGYRFSEAEAACANADLEMAMFETAGEFAKIKEMTGVKASFLSRPEREYFFFAQGPI